MILFKDRQSVEKLLLLLTRRLDRYGLRVNQKKVHLWANAEIQEHRCRRIHAIFAEDGDNRKPGLVQKFVESYLSLSANRLAATWNAGMPLLNRLVWAKIESLPPTLFEEIVSRLTSDSYLLGANKGKLMRINSLNQRLRKPIDLAGRLTYLVENSVHNSFHHEVLSFATKNQSQQLAAKTRERLLEIDHLMESEPTF